MMKEYLIQFQIQDRDYPERSHTDLALVKQTTFKRACAVLKERYPTAYNFQNKTY